MAARTHHIVVCHNVNRQYASSDDTADSDNWICKWKNILRTIFWNGWNYLERIAMNIISIIMRVILWQWQMATIFKIETNNNFIEYVTWAAPWCGRTEPLESSPLSPCCYPQHPRNTDSQKFSTCEMDGSWRHLHRLWLASRQQFQIFRGARQNTPLPHPPTRSNWKCAHACLYRRRYTAQSLGHMTLYQSHLYRYHSLGLSVCLSVSLLPVMQPSVLHSPSLTVRCSLLLLQAALHNFL